MGGTGGASVGGTGGATLGVLGAATVLEGAKPNMNPSCAGFCGGVTCGQCPAPPTGVVCAAGTCTATYAGGR